MKRMLDKTTDRRRKQSEYNSVHQITPRSIVREIHDSLKESPDPREIERGMVKEDGVDYDVHEVLNEMKGEMIEAAQSLEYERAAILRDQIRELENAEEGTP